MPNHHTFPAGINTGRKKRKVMELLSAKDFSIGETVRVCLGEHIGRDGQVIEVGSNWVNVELPPIDEIYRTVRMYIPAHGDICRTPAKVVVVGGNQSDRDMVAERIQNRYK